MAGEGTVWGWWGRFEGRGGNGLRGSGMNCLRDGGWGWRERVGGWGLGDGLRHGRSRLSGFRNPSMQNVSETHSLNRTRSENAWGIIPNKFGRPSILETLMLVCFGPFCFYSMKTWI